jgi:hypothetical protein
MKTCAVVPTGSELVAGIIVDTDGPAISRVIAEFFPQCTTTILPPVPDDADAIERVISACVDADYDLTMLTGGSGGGRRFDPSLAEDCTHAVLASMIGDPAERSLYGSNGHLWARIVAGKLGNAAFVNVPGPQVEAVAAARAVVRVIAKAGSFDPELVVARAAEAVQAEYPRGDPS